MEFTFVWEILIFVLSNVTYYTNYSRKDHEKYLKGSLWEIYHTP